MFRKYSPFIAAILILAVLPRNALTSAGISFTTKSYKLNETTKFEFIQVSGELGDVQEKVNKTLEQAITEWMQNDYFWMAGSEGSVVFQSKEYLTICYSIKLNEGDAVARIFQTVSLCDGSRVFLNDFVPNEEVFVSTLRDSLPNFSDCELVTLYQYASLSENDFLSLMEQKDPLARTFALSYLKDKPDFYLSSEGIIIKISPYEDDNIIIPFCGDIEWKGRIG